MQRNVNWNEKDNKSSDDSANIGKLYLWQRQNVRNRTASIVSMWSIWERNLRFVFQWANDDDEEDSDDNRFVLCQYACWNFFVTFFRHETHDNSHIGICIRTISRTCNFLFDLFYLVIFRFIRNYVGRCGHFRNVTKAIIRNLPWYLCINLLPQSGNRISAVDCGTDYAINIFPFSTKYISLMCKINDWLVQNQDNLFEWSDMTDICFRELVQ
jgi:hypothetical protein